MKLNNYTIGTGVLALMLIIGATSVSAYQGDYTKQGPNYTAERHEAMTQIFDNLNYDTWQELMGDRGRVKDIINEDNFALFVEAHQLAQEGDYEGADSIREELGLRTRNGESLGLGYGKGNGEGQRGGFGTGNCNR